MQVQVIQVLPASLVCRATMFPPLVSAAQLSPGYLDAPGAAAALTPRLLSAPAPALPPVTLLFISPLQLSAVVEHAGQAVGDRAVAVFCDAARAVMSAYGVYECQEFEGAMMAVAHTPRAAAEAALHLNLRLLACEWPEEVLEVEAGREEVHPQTGALLFRWEGCRGGEDEHVCGAGTALVCPGLSWACSGTSHAHCISW